MRIVGAAVLCLLVLSPHARGQGHAPDVAASKMKVAAGLEVELVASEPLVRQPVAIEFDARGRLWCIQYLQYPNPAGLNRVEVDRYSRTKYDKVPEPPPRGPKGSDRITILEDTDGDGRMDRSKDFVTGLSLASSLAFGDSGVYVLQAPYLLFYPDRNGDDRPDSDPIPLVKGFGMEDAHSVANSLTWGPDGWLYGLQGSTVTAKIGDVEFQQGVWRYHPPTRRFELFAEGGGNMWGLDFDRDGELVASTNVGGNVALHFVRGAYYWKQFGKHGALHNPYAYGYFDHIPHAGVKGGHVSVGGLFYEADLFPDDWRGRYVAADLLEHGVHWHDFRRNGSTFVGRQGGDVLEARDTWFAPSDLTLGPDGSLYVTDWHDKRTAHPDPDADWDRSNGRIYRIKPRGAVPRRAADLGPLSTDDLIRTLADPNVRISRLAARLLAERREPETADRMREIVEKCGGPVPCWTALCLLERSGGLDAKTLRDALAHPDPTVRVWALRLYTNRTDREPLIEEVVAARAKSESDVRVLSELAGLADRLTDDAALRVVRELTARGVGAEDPYIPLRLWWSCERLFTRSPSLRGALLEAIAAPSVALARSVLRPRILRRLLAEKEDGLALRILSGADAAGLGELLAVVEEAAGGVGLNPKGDLVRWLTARFEKGADDPLSTRLAAVAGSAAALEKVRRIALDRSAASADRVAAVGLLGRLREVESIDGLVDDPSDPVALAAIAQAGAPLLSKYKAFSPTRRAAARSALLGRVESSLALLRAVDSGSIPASEIPLEEVRRAIAHQDARLNELVRKHWGNLSPATPEAKLAEVRRLNNDLRAARGDAGRGREQFKRNCAACHKLFDEGNAVGPELTHANRKDRDFLLRSLVDPSGVIRKEFQSVAIQTKDGRLLTGLIAGQTPTHLTVVVSADERIVVRRDEVDEMKDSAVSLMPEDLYRKFEPDSLRDLFEYLQSDRPLRQP